MKRQHAFDLQMFGAKITDVAIKELSLIFADHKGEKWQPINGQAQILTTKGAVDYKKDDATTAKGWVARMLETVKGWMGSSSSGWPVSVEVEDNIDGDDDGAADYNLICSLLSYTYYDLQSAYGIGDDEARAAAITAILDGFRASFASICGGGDGVHKAGARHSKEDMGHLAKIQEHATGIGDALKALGAVDDNANSDNAGTADDDVEETDDEEKAKTIVEAAKASEDIGEDGLPATYTVEIEGKARKCKPATYEKLVAVSKADKKKSDEPYGEVKYADPGYQDDKKKRYPLDSEKHVRAAWSYINMPKNAEKYSSGDLKKVKDAILAACKEYGIETDDSKKDDKGTPIGGNAPSDVQALVDAAVSTMKAALETETQTKIDAALSTAKAESDGQIASLKGELSATKAALETANTSIKAMAKDAMKPGSPGFTPTRTESGETVDPASESRKAEAQDKLAQMATGAVKAGSIREVVQLQRVANS